MKTGRNCISLGSTALKLYAQRSIMARLVEEEEESDERLVEEERDEMEHDDN